MDLDANVLTGALDALDAHVAVLDDEGTIVWTNRSWRAFGEANSEVAPGDHVGQNYLEVCRAAGGDTHAQAACDGLEALLDGRRESFSMEYPCHSPDEKRWFVLDASRFEADGETYAVTAHSNVTERKTAELELQRRARASEQVARMLSHDVRNPLAVAHGRMELAAEDAEEAGLETDQFDPAFRALDRIDEMVTNAVTFMRVGVRGMDREPVDVGEAAESAWQSVRTPEAALELADPPTVTGYPSLLSHLFENLFRNAVEHAGPEVTVRVGGLDGERGFYVEDDGPGLPPERGEELFELGATAREGRAGFGLPIVKSVVDAHGWEIRVADSAGGGARFEVATRPTTPRPDAVDEVEDGMKQL
ncbi:MAG: ATP-binding protein [Halobacteriaceae archaeon]